MGEGEGEAWRERPGGGACPEGWRWHATCGMRHVARDVRREACGGKIYGQEPGYKKGLHAHRDCRHELWLHPVAKEGLGLVCLDVSAPLHARRTSRQATKGAPAPRGGETAAAPLGRH